MKTVTYNGVILYGVLTLDWREEAAYDESHTDPIGTKYYLRFQGVCHGYAVQGQSESSQPNYTGPQFIAPLNGKLTTPVNVDGTGTPTATIRYQQVSQALKTPRCDLLVQENGVTLLSIKSCQANDTDPNRDTNNGPKPSDVSITHFASSHAFRVVFTIEAEKVDCSSSGSSRGLVLTNRWAIGEEMDDNFQVTRNIHGILKISSAVHDPNEVQFKAMVVPGLELGFRRERLEYEVSPDGLSAMYSVVDRQVDTAAPYPATKISGDYSESTDDGVTFFSSIDVRLEAPPYTDRSQLLQAAVAAGDARSNHVAKIKASTAWLVHAQIIEHFGDSCWTAYRSTIRYAPTTDSGEPATGLPLDTLGIRLSIPHSSLTKAGNLPTYDSMKSPIPPLYGYTLGAADGGGTAFQNRSPVILLLLACYLQSPCDSSHAIGTSGDQNSAGSDNSGGYQGTNVYGKVTDNPIKKGTATYFSSDQTSQPIYNYARMITTYLKRPVRAQCPIANATPADPSLDTSIAVDLAPPIAQRKIHYEAERIGDWPDMPDPLDSYSDGKITCSLLDQRGGYLSPVLSPDGRSKVFRLEIELVYAMSRHPMPTEKMQVGMLPFAKSIGSSDTSFKQKSIWNDNLGPAPVQSGTTDPSSGDP